MKEYSIEFLQNLLNCPSPSGFEDNIKNIWKEYLSTEIVEKNYNNFTTTIGKNTITASKIMLSAHMDTIGLIIKYIDNEGFIYFDMIGGVDLSILPGKKVNINNENNIVNGVIGSRPIHVKNYDDDVEITIDKLYIDIGALDKDDAENVVCIGDPITFDDGNIQFLLNDNIIAGGLDNKIGVFCIAEVLKELQNLKNFNNLVCASISCQEEIGCFGAEMSVENINPDVALVIDVNIATDHPEMEVKKHGKIELNKGPIISVGPIIDKKVQNSLIKVATEESISYQLSASGGIIGSEVDSIFKAKGGIPTGLVSIPNRYMHTSIEMVNLKDVKNTIRLILKWCIDFCKTT